MIPLSKFDYTNRVRKKFAYLVIFISMGWIFGCEDTPEPAPADEETTTASALNPEDCNTTSGYIWSSLYKDCVNIFKEARKLKPAHPDANQHGSVFVLFGKDDLQVEVYYPFERGSKLYQKVKGAKVPRWKNDDRVVECPGRCVFLEKEKMLYAESEK